MTYLSQDLNILDEIIQDRAKIELTEYYGKQQVTLAETDGISYSITINQIPEDTIVIKSDYFEAPQRFFKSKRGECKRSDFIIITDDNEKKFIIFIEMKKTKAQEKEIIQQFKGSECLITYCQKIGQLFWNYPYFLTEYEYRFVSLKHITVHKPPTRDKNSKLHDRPENMLKYSPPRQFPFRKLTDIKSA